MGIDYPGFELPEIWSIADVDANDWPNQDVFTGCLLRDGRIVVVVPLEQKRFRVISNTKDALTALPLKMNVTNIRRAGTFEISVRQVNEYRKGRVFLAGDAAHCHSPVGGRGMNLGIADAADLARRMHENDLEGYSDARHVDGATTIEFSEQARKTLTSTNPITRFVIRSIFKLTSHTPYLQRRAARRALFS